MKLELIYRKYRTEDERIEAVYSATHPAYCPNCGRKILRRRPKPGTPKEKAHSHQYVCSNRDYYASALENTIFFHSRHPLSTNFELIKMIHHNPKMDARLIASTLGISLPWVKRRRPIIRRWLYTLENEDKDRQGRPEIQPVDKES